MVVLIFRFGLYRVYNILSVCILYMDKKDRIITNVFVIYALRKCCCIIVNMVFTPYVHIYIKVIPSKMTPPYILIHKMQLLKLFRYLILICSTYVGNV